MRPRTLRELTEMARDEMSPTEEERGRVYDSLCVAVAAGAAGAALAASTTASAAVSTTTASTATSAAASTTAASTTAASTAASSTAAAASGAVAQGGALAAGAAQAGGALASSGLLLKGLVLLVAVGGGVGLLSAGDGDVVAEQHAQSVLTEEVVPLRRATEERIEATAETALIAPVQELGVQELTPARASDSPRRRTQARVLAETNDTAPSTDEDRASNVEEGEPLEVDAVLTRAARRLQRAQRAMAQGDGASTLALLADDVDPRLRAERLALRVLALCQVGDVRGAQREANELRALDGSSSAALARISNSCAQP